jgi:hypothetical protein
MCPQLVSQIDKAFHFIQSDMGWCEFNRLCQQPITRRF